MRAVVVVCSVLAVAGVVCANDDVGPDFVPVGPAPPWSVPPQSDPRMTLLHTSGRCRDRAAPPPPLPDSAFIDAAAVLRAAKAAAASNTTSAVEVRPLLSAADVAKLPPPPMQCLDVLDCMAMVPLEQLQEVRRPRAAAIFPFRIVGARPGMPLKPTGRAFGKDLVVPKSARRQAAPMTNAGGGPRRLAAGSASRRNHNSPASAPDLIRPADCQHVTVAEVKSHAKKYALPSPTVLQRMKRACATLGTQADGPAVRAFALALGRGRGGGGAGTSGQSRRKRLNVGPHSSGSFCPMQGPSGPVLHTRYFSRRPQASDNMVPSYEAHPAERPLLSVVTRLRDTTVPDTKVWAAMSPRLAAAVEFVYVDDGSTTTPLRDTLFGGTRLEPLPPVRLVAAELLHSVPDNQAGAWNTGAALARGRFMLFRPAATAVSMQHLEAMVEYLLSLSKDKAATTAVVPTVDGASATDVVLVSRSVFAASGGFKEGRFDVPAMPAFMSCLLSQLKLNVGSADLTLPGGATGPAPADVAAATSLASKPASGWGFGQPSDCNIDPVALLPYQVLMDSVVNIVTKDV